MGSIGSEVIDNTLIRYEREETKMTDIVVDEEAAQYYKQEKISCEKVVSEFAAIKSEFPEKVKKLFREGLSTSVSRGGNDYDAYGRRQLSVGLKINVNAEGVSEYVEKIGTELRELRDSADRNILDMDKKLEQYKDTGIDSRLFSDLIRLLRKWIDFRDNMDLSFTGKQIKFDPDEEHRAIREKWDRFGNIEMRKAEAARLGIPLQELDKYKAYLNAKEKYSSAKTSSEMQQAYEMLRKVSGYKDADTLTESAFSQISNMKKQEEKERIEREQAKALIEQQDKIIIEGYYSDYKRWEDECASIKREREKRISEKMNDIRTRLEGETSRRLAPGIEKLKEDITLQESRRSDAETRISSLGFFKFAEKKEQKSIIEETISRINSLRDKLSESERELTESLSAAVSEAGKNEPEIRKEIEADCPLPEEPTKPAEVYEAERRQKEEKERLEREEKERRAEEKGVSVLEYELLESMDVNKEQTVTELAGLMGWSNQRTDAVMRGLVRKGLAERFIFKRIAYFKKIK